MKSDHVDIRGLPEQPFDFPLGTGTGAAVIFGATGGVMDAALRSAYYLVTGRNPDADAFLPVRGMDGWKEAAFDIPGAGTVRVAVAHGLGNTRKLMEAIQAGKAHYDFVEIMACPAAAPAAAASPSTTAWRWPPSAARSSGSWTRAASAASPTKTPRFTPSTPSIWKSPSPTGRTSCSTPTTTAWNMPPQAR